MKDLNKFDVQGMNTRELQVIDGGYLAIAGLILGAAATYYSLGEAIGKAWKTYDQQ